jgi:hypothetical protein
MGYVPPNHNAAEAARAATKLLEPIVAILDEGFVELRMIAPEGRARGSEFFPIADASGAAARAVVLALESNVYFSVIPRLREGGRGGADVGLAPVVWADIDGSDAVGNLQRFPHQPSILVASGGGSGHLHAYWLLEAPEPAKVVVELNRELAGVLGADVRATDAARILRLPGTLNHKANPPTEVRLIKQSDRRHSFAELRKAVLSPVPDGSEDEDTRTAADVAPSPATIALLESLDGVARGNGRWTARCPAHDDKKPSLSIKEGHDGKPLLNCHAGCTYDDILAALDPELGSDVRRGRPPGRDAHARLMQIVEKAGVELIHSPDGQPYAIVPIAEHTECWDVRGKTLDGWIRRTYYRCHTASPPRESLAQVVELLAAQAQFDGPERRVHRRIGGDFDEMFIDLADADSRVVAIRADGSWRVLKSAPIAFVREEGMLALPVPEGGGSIDDLRPLTNADDTGWALIRGALLAAYHPYGPYFTTLITGPAGSGKSSLGRWFARLVDPHSAQFLAGTAKPSDVIVTAARSWLVAMDNVSHITRPMSDLLCTLSTGAGDRKRALYSNADAFSLEAKRPTLITSIGHVVTRPDLVSRSVPVTLEVLASRTRRSERELEAEFERVRGRVFGGIVQALAGALHHLPATRLDEPPRMADATLFVTAAEGAMGIEPGGFHAALRAAQGEALEESVGASPFVEAVVRLIEQQHEFCGSATQLLAAAAGIAPILAGQRGWPPTSSAATTQLQEHQITLARRSIKLETGIRTPGGNRDRRLRITKAAA